MKKNIFVLLLILTTYIAFAQTKTDSSAHLTFKGVPIDGALEQYISLMKQNGFEHISTENGTARLQGDFAGYNACKVSVSTLKSKDLVHKIDVFFPNRDTWSTLSGNYFDLKQMLLEKYGNPSDELEKFNGNYEPDEDRAKILAVRMDNCKFHSIWKTDKGEIHLSIGNTSRECFIKLTYFDKINGATIKKQAIDDL